MAFASSYDSSFVSTVRQHPVRKRSWWFFGRRTEPVKAPPLRPANDEDIPASLRREAAGRGNVLPIAGRKYRPTAPVLADYVPKPPEAPLPPPPLKLDAIQELKRQL